MTLYTIESGKNCDFFLDTLFSKTGWGQENTIRVVGLDTETCTKRAVRFPATNTFPSTIQLAFGSGLVALIHIHHIVTVKKEPFPWSLKRLLSSSHILKSGVSLSLDTQGFQQHFDVQVKNTLDIDAIAKPVAPRCSLAALVYLYTGELLKKPKRLVFSPWDSLKLSDRALAYAGYDAYFSRELYFELVKKTPNQATFEELGRILKPGKPRS